MYAISIEGITEFTTKDWHELIREFRKRRKQTDKPVLMGKINEKGEFEE